MRSARSWLPDLHPVGWAGVLLWCVAVLIAAAAVVSRVDRRHAAQRPADSEGIAYQQRATAIAGLLARVPPQTERERLLAEALAAAQGAGLQINGGRYDEARSPGLLQRIESTLPVTGDAVAVLRWLDALGERAPTATVSRVTLTRGAPEEPFVGDIKLDLHVRSAQ